MTEGARDGLTSRRRPVPWSRGVVVGCVIGVAVVVASVTLAWMDDDALTAPSGWERLPDSPLGPRSEVVGVWTGEEVLFVGGSLHTCSDGGDCGGPIGPYLADGAALDPETGTWRLIAPAPVAFSRASTAVIGDDVYFLVQLGFIPSEALLRYSLDGDSWHFEPPPPVDWYSTLLAADDQLMAYDSRKALLFDRASETWEPLPPSPASASLGGTMVYADGDLYLFSRDSGAMPERPPLVRGARLDMATGTWAHLPDSAIRGNDAWFADGELLVNPMVDSGPGAIARWPENPSGGIFNMASDEWLPLPAFPAGERGAVEERSAGVVGEKGALYLPSGSSPLQGMVLDLEAGAWLEMPPLDDPGFVTQRTVVTAGKDAVVLGGSRWDARSPAARGEALGDAWIWRPGR